MITFDSFELVAFLRYIQQVKRRHVDTKLLCFHKLLRSKHD